MSELRSLLGLCYAYRQLVPNLPRVAAPLNKRLNKGEPTRLKLNDKGRQKVDGLNQKLITPAILALQRASRQYIIANDACDKQISCVPQ